MTAGYIFTLLRHQHTLPAFRIVGTLYNVSADQQNELERHQMVEVL